MAGYQLVPVDNLLAITGQADIPEVSDVLVEAVSSATLYLSSLLNTELTRGTASDKFVVTGQDSVGGYVKLALANGFVVDGSVSLSVGATVLDALAATPLLASSYEVNLEKGMVLLYDGYNVNDVVVATYTKGFTDTAKLYTQSEVPAWLQESASLYAIHLVNTSASFTEAGKRFEPPISFLALVDGHLRLDPSAVKPIF